MERRAKIVATIGPASADDAVLAKLIASGMDVVRLNLSHGTQEDHRRMIHNVRRLAAAANRFVPVIADLMGPRFRLGQLDLRQLEEGERVSLGEGEVDLPVEDPSFLSHVQPGERLLIDNGMVELEILEKRQAKVLTRVVTGGAVTTRKGINLPDTELPFTISDKDHSDIAFAVAERADYLAVSFVGGADDLIAVRQVVSAAGGEIPLIAKLERATAMRRLEHTVLEADAVMVARGDLGVEVPLHQVPVYQKRIIAIGRRLGTPVIVATQMLESMMERPRPTRAESSDVANAVFDGADALMLSGETAAGAYPVTAVRTMARIILEAEAYRSAHRDHHSDGKASEPILPGLHEQAHIEPNKARDLEIPDVVSEAAVVAAGRLNLRQIIAFSQSGFTARMIARYRPRTPLTVVTHDLQVARRLQLVWGARPLLIEVVAEHHDQLVEIVDGLLLDEGLAEVGDVVIMLMGVPVSERPLTNLMRVHRVRKHPPAPTLSVSARLAARTEEDATVAHPILDP